LPFLEPLVEAGATHDDGVALLRELGDAVRSRTERGRGFPRGETVGCRHETVEADADVCANEHGVLLPLVVEFAGPGRS
jgi:hypothetical protein